MFNDLLCSGAIREEIQKLYNRNDAIIKMDLDTSIHRVATRTITYSDAKTPPRTKHSIRSEGNQLDHLSTALLYWFHATKIINIETLPLEANVEDEAVQLAHASTPLLAAARASLPHKPIDIEEYELDHYYAQLAIPARNIFEIADSATARGTAGAVTLLNLIILLCDPDTIPSTVLTATTVDEKIRIMNTTLTIMPLICPVLCRDGKTRNLHALADSGSKPEVIILCAATTKILRFIWPQLELLADSLAENVILRALIQTLKQRKEEKLINTYNGPLIQRNLTALNLRYQTQVYFDYSEKKSIVAYTGTAGLVGISAGTSLMLAVASVSNPLCIAGITATATGLLCYAYAAIDYLSYGYRRTTCHDAMLGRVPPLDVVRLSQQIETKLLVKEIHVTRQPHAAAAHSHSSEC